MGLVISVCFILLELMHCRLLLFINILFITFIRSIPEVLVVLFIYFSTSKLLSSIINQFSVNIDFSYFSMHWTANSFDISAFLCGVIALSLLYAAYASQILISALKSVSVGQKNSGKALGMKSISIFFRLTLPQMWRYALPGLGNQWLVLLKDTSLVSLISVNDLMMQTKKIINITQKPFIWYLIAATIYLIITLISESILRVLKRRVTYFDQET